MPIPTLPPTTSLVEARAQWLYTQARLEADTRTGTLATTLSPWESLWQTGALEHQRLDDAVVRAAARIDVADAVLDALVDQVDLAALAASKKDRSHPVYAALFAAKTPSELKRPVLGPELELVRAWPAQLGAVAHADLQALQAPLQAAIEGADAALAAKLKAETDLSNFESLGLGRQLLDKLNAMRDAVHGELKQLRHDHADWNLDATWPDAFFMHDSRGAHVVRTVADASARVATLQTKLDQAKAQLADLEAKAAKAARSQQDQDTLAAQAAEAEKLAKDAAAKARALKAASKKR